MEHSQATITYLFHSGFSVETAHHFFLFDYCPSMDRDRQITGELLKTKENVYVFASHNHGDHFDSAILKWADENPAITYVLSSDVIFQRGSLKCHVMSAYEEWADRGMKVKAYGSTDEGISFRVKADGLSIFHAGDLNWWRWSGETQAEQEYAETIFKAEMDKMAGEQIDIAMFPVDRRLEENFSIGAEYFAAKFHPQLLIPMHFGQDFGATTAFLEKAKRIGQRTVEITKRGQEISY